VVAVSAGSVVNSGSAVVEISVCVVVVISGISVVVISGVSIEVKVSEGIFGTT
jgi:hypothetical protein